jgi:hypothetical protein
VDALELPAERLVLRGKEQHEAAHGCVLERLLAGVHPGAVDVRGELIKGSERLGAPHDRVRACADPVLEVGLAARARARVRVGANKGNVPLVRRKAARDDTEELELVEDGVVEPASVDLHALDEAEAVEDDRRGEVRVRLQGPHNAAEHDGEKQAHENEDEAVEDEDADPRALVAVECTRGA